MGHAVVYAEKVIGGEPFAVVLADGYVNDPELGITADIVFVFKASDNSQLYLLRIDGPGVTKYGVLMPNSVGRHISGLVEKSEPMCALSNIASIGGYVFTSDIFNILHSIPPYKRGEIQLADGINVQGQERTLKHQKIVRNKFAQPWRSKSKL